MENQTSPTDQAKLEELIREVRDLRNRVMNLERRFGEVPPQMEAVSVTTPPPAGFLPDEVPSLPDTVSTLPVLGRALLGLAGAYLLRALTDFGTLPHALGVALGVVYAGVWLILAARVPAEKTLAVTMNCFTSVLVLAPLLWEATLRFHVLSEWVTAGVLVLFSIFGLAISWRKDLSIIAWVTTLAGMGTAAALLVATRDVLPFTLALLAIAAAIEFSACCDHWVGERWIAAIITDLAVLLMTFLVARRGGVPEGYAPIRVYAVVAVQIALLAIYLASTAVRTLYRNLDFTVFEVVQVVAAFLLCIGGSLKLAAGDQTAFWLTGAFAILSGTFCYVVSFAFLEKKERRERNFYTYSTFGMLIVLAGSLILLSDVPLAAVWSLLALGCLWLGGHFGRSTVRLHGTIYLILVSLASGIIGRATVNLLKSGSGWEHPSLAGWLSAGTVLIGYPLAVWTARPEKTHWVERVSVLLAAANFIWTIALLSIGVPYYVWYAVEGTAKTGLIATSQTGILTLLSLALAWIGKRWQMQELSWLAFPMIILTGYRILIRDFSVGNTLALFASLLLYGGALVVLPKVLARYR